MSIAILDTGIRWQNTELVNKVRLNQGELPLPQHANGSNCASYDCNGDGAVQRQRLRRRPARLGERRRRHLGHGGTNADTFLDASDLIATFSDGTDADANGYVDDIAGWDFFDDDNDPFDASSCCSANGHGSGRAEEALAQTNNAAGQTGLCPRCQLDAAADLGLVRSAHRQLGARRHLRRRQRRRAWPRARSAG